MDTLMQVLPVVLYFLGIILLIVLIILSVKLIHTIDKANKILDDIYTKTRSLNGLFSVIDRITDTVSSVSDTIVGVLSSTIGRVFSKRKRKKMEDFDDE